MSEKQARVFAVQAPARRDGPRGGWIEKYDISAAESFGRLVRVLFRTATSRTTPGLPDRG